ncbi:UNVERIFIED_CONTAM: hypothetical protein FKN15_030241 [Acipenser sinensis]
MRVEVYGCVYKSDVADFNGRSSLLYRFNQKSMSTVKDVISLKFKSMQSDGVLVHGEGQRGDYITLELHRGKLALHINLDDAKLRSSSSSRVSVTLGSLLDDQHWHSVLIERFNKQLNFTVDKHTQHFRTRGDCDSLDIDYEGNVTFSCSDPQMVPVTFLSSTSSYLLLPVDSQADGLSLRFQFRTWNREGLLLSSQLFQKPELLLLYLSNGKLKLTHQKSLLEKTELTTGHGLNDGLWHTVSLSTRGLQVSLTLDNDASSTMEANLHIHSGDSYFFGGNNMCMVNHAVRGAQGNVTFSCSDPQMVPVTFLSSTSSYLLLPVDSQADGLSLRFQFRTWNREGLLLSSQLFQKPELLLLYLSNGKLKLTHQKSLLEKTELTTGHGLNDGLWHTVSLSTRGLQVSLTLDNDASSTMEANLHIHSGDSYFFGGHGLNDGLWHTVSLSTRGLQVSLTLDNDASSTMEANLHIHSGDSYFFGGCPSTTNNLGCKNPMLAFQGCMRLIFINNQPMNLIQVQQGLLGNHSDLQIDLCGIRDRMLGNPVALELPVLLLTLGPVHRDIRPSCARTPRSDHTSQPVVPLGMPASNARRGRCVTVVCLPAMAKQNHGEYQRCLPNNCEHGGQCSQSWSTFYCDCSGTGYTGATCHNSIYEPSCEAYRHTGSTSGYFSIDSDGSGPLGPTLVYCNMTDDKVWTTMHHNSMELTRVQGSSLEKPYSMQFNYSTSREQLQAMVSGAEHCEQEILYRCKRSRLLNARGKQPGATPFTGVS